uniref:DUF3223 domain-containing protein n=1 Tax=Steinernema glaseri TaxID=37863 RepID=A0A1I7YVM3_9BILA
MSSTDINLSLDEIIKKNKKSKGGANRQGQRKGNPKKAAGKGVKKGRISKPKAESSQKSHPLDPFSDESSPKAKDTKPAQKAHPLDPFADDSAKQKPRVNKKGAQKKAGGSVQDRLSAIKNRLKGNRGGAKGFKPRGRK